MSDNQSWYMNNKSNKKVKREKTKRKNKQTHHIHTAIIISPKSFFLHIRKLKLAILIVTFLKIILFNICTLKIRQPKVYNIGLKYKSVW